MSYAATHMTSAQPGWGMRHQQRVLGHTWTTELSNDARHTQRPTEQRVCMQGPRGVGPVAAAGAAWCVFLAR